MTGCLEPIFEQQQGYQRIYLDLPGMGRSDTEPSLASADAILELLLHFIEDVIGDQPFLLAGESYGGYLARGILARKMAQVAGLLLICPVVCPNPQERVLPEKSLVIREVDFAEEGKEADFFEIQVLQTESSYQRFSQEILVGNRLMNQDFISRLQEQYAFTFDPDQEIGSQYSGPSLFIAGKQDQIAGYQQLADLAHSYPRASLALLDAAGHNAQIDQASLFTALIENWLGRIEDR